MRPNNYKAYAWLGIALSLLLVGALQVWQTMSRPAARSFILLLVTLTSMDPQVQGEAGHDEEAVSMCENVCTRGGGAGIGLPSADLSRMTCYYSAGFQAATV